MKGRAIAVLVWGVLFLACNRGDDSFREVKDKDMILQVSEIKDKAPGDESLTYKARLIPSKVLTENETIEQKRLLSYKMDSCFYINDGHHKNYASMVQAVANGVSGTYEYLLVFELDKNESKDSVDLLYQDRYINHKLYELKLNKQ